MFRNFLTNTIHEKFIVVLIFYNNNDKNNNETFLMLSSKKKSLDKVIELFLLMQKWKYEKAKTF